MQLFFEQCRKLHFWPQVQTKWYPWLWLTRKSKVDHRTGSKIHNYVMQRLWEVSFSELCWLTNIHIKPKASLPVSIHPKWSISARIFLIIANTQNNEVYNYSISQEICTPFCFAVLCCGYTLTDFSISMRLTSLALWQSNDCSNASKATLMNMDKNIMWIHYERLPNHNKAKHNKTVCIFLGIYCISYRKLLLSTRICKCSSTVSVWIPLNRHMWPLLFTYQ